ncbi:MAG: OsmC family peroxiredoxin [Caldilineaceae bacterium]
MAVTKAEAVWQGTLREGKGTMKLPKGNYEGPFTFASRFETGDGTNPEELIGAAHAGCFSMFLSALLSKEKYTPAYSHHRHRHPGRRTDHHQDRTQLRGRSPQPERGGFPEVRCRRQGRLPCVEGAGRASERDCLGREVGLARSDWAIRGFQI